MAPDISETLNTVTDFLGKERTDELKNYILEHLKEIIYESINDHWMVFPINFDVMGEFEASKNSIMKTYKKILTEEMSKKVEEYIETLKNTTIGKDKE